MDGYLGQIMAWGPNWAPKGWAFCNGALLTIADNASLYSLLGAYYGGDGRISFGLPNLQGRTAIGSGYGSGLTPRIQGQLGGEESVVLSVSQIPAHSHDATSVPGTAQLPLSTTKGVNATPEAGDVPAAASDDIYGPNSNTVNTPLNINVPDQQVTVGATGGSQAHDNMQPFQVISYIICIDGDYPTRP